MLSTFRLPKLITACLFCPIGDGYRMDQHADERLPRAAGIDCRARDVLCYAQVRCVAWLSYFCVCMCRQRALPAKSVRLVHYITPYN